MEPQTGSTSLRRASTKAITPHAAIATVPAASFPPGAAGGDGPRIEAPSGASSTASCSACCVPQPDSSMTTQQAAASTVQTRTVTPPNLLTGATCGAVPQPGSGRSMSVPPCSGPSSSVPPCSGPSMSVPPCSGPSSQCTQLGPEFVGAALLGPRSCRCRPARGHPRALDRSPLLPPSALLTSSLFKLLPRLCYAGLGPFCPPGPYRPMPPAGPRRSWSPSPRKASHSRAANTRSAGVSWPEHVLRRPSRTGLAGSDQLVPAPMAPTAEW